MSETIQKPGKRGPDKAPRTRSTGVATEKEDKATCRNVAMLTPAQDATVIKLFGNAKKAMLWAIGNYPKMQN